MPYLKTTERVVVRGIPFWPSQDLETNHAIDDDSKAHLRLLFSMFFLQNEIRIQNMIYTHLDVEINPGEPSDILSRLREACILIGFFYSSPHFPGGDPFLLREHADLHIFSATKVSKFLLGQVDESPTSTHQNSLQSNEVEGYEGLLNWHSHHWVADGSRIYPSLPHFWLNFSQDISHDLGLLEHRSHSLSLHYFMNRQDAVDEKTKWRIFTALEWYNRSCSGQISQEVSLVHLATAFESLFNLPQGPDLTDRFKESVMLLLGRIPRLDSWIDQFYKARSKVLHEGNWPHMAFYAADSEAYKAILKGKQEGVVYRSLAAYGRRIFRICLQTILAGALASEETGLASLFFHNQERLVTICHQISRNDIEPIEKLKQVSQTILDLHEYWLESENITDLKSVLGTGVLLIKVFLESKPQLPNEVEQSLLSIVNMKSDLDEYEQFMLFKNLAVALSHWRGEGMSGGDLGPKDPLDILQLYLKYATMPGFILRTRWPKDE
jgi:hypothetical protein